MPFITLLYVCSEYSRVHPAPAHGIVPPQPPPLALGPLPPRGAAAGHAALAAGSTCIHTVYAIHTTDRMLDMTTLVDRHRARSASRCRPSKSTRTSVSSRIFFPCSFIHSTYIHTYCSRIFFPCSFIHSAYIHTYCREAAPVLPEVGHHLEAERAHSQEVSPGRRGDVAGQGSSPQEEALRSHEGNPRWEIFHQAGVCAGGVYLLCCAV